MTIRRGRPLTIQPSGCTDAMDGTNAPKGSMLALSNLVPSLRTAGYWEPRPARTYLATLYLFNTPGLISCMLVVGNRLYGMAPSLRNPGHDEPFVVDLTTGGMVVVNGVTNANTPLQPPGPFAGRWTPPIMAQVAGRIIVTHPGFPGGASNVPFTGTFVANTHNGSPILDGQIGNFANLTPGTQLSDAPTNAIPAGTVVLSSNTVALATTATGTAGNNFFVVANATDVAVGQYVSFADPNNVPTTVTGVAGTTITIAINLVDNIAGGAVYFSGAQVVMSQNATANTSSDGITATRPFVAGMKFGWFDISGFSTNTLVGNVTIGSAVIEEVPNTIGLQPGMTIAGTGIPAGTTITDLSPSSLVIAGTAPNPGDTTLVVTYQLQPNQPLPFLPPAGAEILGAGIVTGTTVSVAPTILNQSNLSMTILVNLSQPAVGGFAGLTNFQFSFLPQIMMSQVATGSATQTGLAINGGTMNQPLWGAGDTAINHLPSNPVGVAQFNGRAYYACTTDGIPFSDSGFPALMTNANQALTTDDGLATTAVAGLPLTSALTGGIIQSLIVFEGATKIQQITGDYSTSTLAMNELNIPSGTLAPLSITPSQIGLTFMSPEGLRVINFQSQVSDPIGHHGTGVTAPFINALTPSRMAAAASVDTIRITVQNAQTLGQPYVEWWYNLGTKKWSGPHTLQTTLLQPWTDPGSGVNTFVTAAADVVARIYRSDSYVSGTSSFTEDGVNLNWEIQTTLLPDNAGMVANSVVETNLGMVLPASQAVTVTATSEDGVTLDQVSIPGNYVLPIWGGMPLWGSGQWYSVESFLHQFLVPWKVPICFKQMQLTARGSAFWGLAVGNLYLLIQPMRFVISPYPAQILALTIPALTNQPRGLVAPSAASVGTVIGPVLVVVGSTIILTATIDLAQNPSGNLALAPFSDATVTGTTNGTTTVGTLSANPVSRGWQVGYQITDTAGSIPAGTWIAAIDPAGAFITLSQAASGSVIGDGLIVTGTDLVTNWASPLAIGIKVYGQIRAIASGYTTGYFQFLVTVV